MKPGVDWDDNLINSLKRLHAQGDLSFTQMAAKLSYEFGVRLSKNALIGKARRLELDKREPVFPPKPRRKKPPPPPAETVPVILPAWKIEPPKLPAATGRITIYQLERGFCHFPFGDRPPYAYCGTKAARSSSWCPHHERVVYPRGKAL